MLIALAMLPIATLRAQDGPATIGPELPTTITLSDSVAPEPAIADFDGDVSAEETPAELPAESAEELGTTSEQEGRANSLFHFPGSITAGPIYYGADYTNPRYIPDRCLQVLPDGLIYRPYLAGPKEPRLGAHIARIPDDTWIWGATVGGRVGLLRLGSSDPIRPRGFQIDAEGAAMIRLDIEEQTDVRSADFRGGVGFSWGNEVAQMRFAYYHLSSHLGDEFLIKNPTFPVFGQSRDALTLGLSYYLLDDLRLYSEVGWAFASTASEPWEVQFGIDYAPRQPTGFRGAPFIAANGHLREEHDFGGGVTVQAGWAWRADTTAHLFRVGFLYFNGKSSQYAFLPYHEELLGAGMWYDF